MVLLFGFLVAIFAMIALSALLFFGSYKKTVNTLVALDARCDTAFSDIDVHLKHRHNLIPPLIEMTKGVVGYEKDMVDKLIEARADAMSAIKSHKKLKAEGNITAQIGSLLASIDKMPELRALPEFHNLRTELTSCENRITAARRFYNLAIEEYNVGLKQFPGSYVATKRRMSSRQPFSLGIERVLLDEPVALSF
jgi:LemA protein